MKQPRRQKQLNLRYNSRKTTPVEPEHGDWRVWVEHPEEAEHYVNPPMSVWKRLGERTALLYSSTATLWNPQTEAGWEPLTGPKLWFRVLFSSVVLLPLSIIMLFALLLQLFKQAPKVGTLETIDFWISEPVWYTLMGVLVFAILIVAGAATVVWMYAYVLGHELTHAIAAKLSFGRISDIRIARDGGYVETDADNAFVALSPYFVPFWLLVWLGGLWLVNFIYPFEAFLPWFHAGIGFWGSFHIYWTIWIIPREQPDMLSNGIMFSALVIFIMNLVALIGVLCLFHAVSLQGYGEDFIFCAKETYAVFADLAGDAWVLLRVLWSLL